VEKLTVANVDRILTVEEDKGIRFAPTNTIRR